MQGEVQREGCCQSVVGVIDVRVEFVWCLSLGSVVRRNRGEGVAGFGEVQNETRRPSTLHPTPHQS